MTEILVGPDVDHVPDCWSKFCMHCASKMWDSNLSIDQVIREELIPYNAILEDFKPDIGYKVVFKDRESYMWFCLKF